MADGEQDFYEVRLKGTHYKTRHAARLQAGVGQEGRAQAIRMAEEAALHDQVSLDSVEVWRISHRLVWQSFFPKAEEVDGD